MTPGKEAARTAMVLGATGLVGRHLWPLLQAHSGIWTRIILLVRRPITDLPAPVESRVSDFERLEESLDEANVDDLFCCLGSTMAKAGSREAFRRVDHDYVVDTARKLQRTGLKQAVAVSAVGADPESPFFYSRVKGEMEQDLEALGLDFTVIVRPSLLLGKRGEQRFLEGLAVSSSPLWGWMLRGPAKAYRPVKAETVAAAMVAAALENIRQGPEAAPLRYLGSGEMMALQRA